MKKPTISGNKKKANGRDTRKAKTFIEVKTSNLFTYVNQVFILSPYPFRLSKIICNFEMFNPKWFSAESMN